MIHREFNKGLRKIVGNLKKTAMIFKYLFPFSKLPQGKELESVATDLGVSLHETYQSRTLDEPELQKRVLAALSSRRNSCLWLLAFLSFLASIAIWLAA